MAHSWHAERHARTCFEIYPSNALSSDKSLAQAWIKVFRIPYRKEILAIAERHEQKNLSHFTTSVQDLVFRKSIVSGYS